MRLRFGVGLLVVAVLTAFQPWPARAQRSGVGLGVILGDPTGLSLKVWLGGRTAIDGGLAWSFRGGGDGSVHIHGDYLIHHDLSRKLSSEGSANLRGVPMFYYGIGGRLRDDPVDNRVSLRIPLGLAHAFHGPPLDFFVEAVPLLDLAPETKFDMNGALGVRLFF